MLAGLPAMDIYVIYGSALPWITEDDQIRMWSAWRLISEGWPSNSHARNPCRGLRISKTKPMDRSMEAQNPSYHKVELRNIYTAVMSTALV